LVAARGKFIRCTSPVAGTGKKPIAAGFLAKSARLFPELRLPEPRDNLEKNSVRPSLNLLSGLVLYGIGEGLVLRKPSRMGMPVRADDGERSHMLIKRPGYSSCARLGRKQTIWMEQHDSNTTLALRIGKRRCRSGTSVFISIHGVIISGLSPPQFQVATPYFACADMSRYGARVSAGKQVLTLLGGNSYEIVSRVPSDCLGVRRETKEWWLRIGSAFTRRIFD